MVAAADVQVVPEAVTEPEVDIKAVVASLGRQIAAAEAKIKRLQDEHVAARKEADSNALMTRRQVAKAREDRAKRIRDLRAEIDQKQRFVRASLPNKRAGVPQPRREKKAAPDKAAK